MTSHAGPPPDGPDDDRRRRGEDRRRRRLAALLALPAAAALGAVAGWWAAQPWRPAATTADAGREASLALPAAAPGAAPATGAPDAQARRLAELEAEVARLRDLPAVLDGEARRGRDLERELATTRRELADARGGEGRAAGRAEAASGAGAALEAREDDLAAARAGPAAARDAVGESDETAAGQAAAGQAASGDARGGEPDPARVEAAEARSPDRPEAQRPGGTGDGPAGGPAVAPADGPTGGNPPADVARLEGALSATRERLRAAEAERGDLAATSAGLDDLRPSAAGAPGAASSPPAGSPPPDAAARTLATLVREVAGEGRFEAVEDDRIVVRSSTIFPTGEADIGGDGRATLAELAGRLRAAAARLPAETPWALRVDGHADDRPTGEGGAFPSNWQLSAARASNVVEFLASSGVPADRLVAAAFGDTRPLAPGTDEEARERNRRIELRFVTR